MVESSPVRPLMSARRIVRGGAGQQHPAQNGSERLGIDVGADGCRDRLGDRVGLLGGQAALLDREGGRVTGGVYAVEADDAPVGVGQDEAVACAGDAAQSRSGQTRHG